MSTESVDNKIGFNQSVSDSPIYLARNWWILPLLGITSTLVGLFCGWLVTAQAIKATQLGQEIPGGWSWTSVILCDLLIICSVLIIVWSPLVQLRTVFTDEYISYPSLFGRRTISWKAITSCGLITINGFKIIEIKSDKQRFRINPHYYKDAGKLTDVINEHVSGSEKH